MGGIGQPLSSLVGSCLDARSLRLSYFVVQSGEKIGGLIPIIDHVGLFWLQRVVTDRAIHFSPGIFMKKHITTSTTMYRIVKVFGAITLLSLLSLIHI